VARRGAGESGGSNLPYELTPDEDTDEREGEGVGFDDADGLNAPDMEELPEAPVIGRSTEPSEMFGRPASVYGRPTSPRLVTEAARFPAATQLRVWKIDNGTPVGVGTIDVNASEEDFIEHFYDSMPKRGEKKAAFNLRPIDIRGNELGQEVTRVVSENHAYLLNLRARKEAEVAQGVFPGGYPPGGYPPGYFGQQPFQPDPATSSMADSMNEMFQRSVEMAELQTRQAQEQLEREREGLREQERQRAEERIRSAERATGVVEQMTERLMATDKARSNEALAAQKQNSDLMINTIATVFSQQQLASAAAAERQRQLDADRAAADREFYDRQRRESEERRTRELAEAEARRRAEREEAEAKRQAEREEAEARRRNDQAEWERKQAEAKLEAERRSERERAELELRRDQIKAEAERVKAELEERRRLDAEERERRDRVERERWEREKLDHERRESIRREEMERVERRRAEEMERAERRRTEELALQLKQMDQSATRDREHAERMMAIAQQEREAQRESALQREKMEREAREQADRERQRQHELAMKEMDLARERDREHGERMLQLSREKSSGGLTAFNDLLGMDTAEVLGRIFGGSGGEEGGGWVEAVPKVLASLADLGKTALAAKTGEGQEGKPRKPRPALTGQQQVAIQTPNGPRMVAVSDLIQQQMLNTPRPTPTQVVAAPIPTPAPTPVPMEEMPDLPTQPFLPPESPEPPGNSTPPPPSPGAVEANRRLVMARKVNKIARGRAAGLTVAVMRQARKSVKELTSRLAAAPEEQWVGIVAEALVKNPEIVDYLKAVTVYVALAEAGVEPELAERFVSALRGSSMVPEGLLPYDEDDFLKMQVAAEAEAVAVAKDVAAVEADLKGEEAK